MDTQARRDEFIAAALELFTQKGFSHTSIQDITERVGVTRSLFYHYFADKQAITDAAIDKQINDFMAYVRDWTIHLNGTDVRDALVALTAIVRTRLHAPMSLGDRIMHEQDAVLFQRFITRTSRQLADYFVKTRGERGAFIQLTDTRHPRESFYVLSVGIMSLMLRQPETPDDLIADLIIDTLHIDLG